MATKVENKNEQAKVAEQSYFELKATRKETKLVNGETLIEVTPSHNAAGVTVGNVIVNDNGMGVQINRPDAGQDIPKGPGVISDDCKTANAFGAAVRVTDGLTTVVTDGNVTLVNKEAEALAAAQGTTQESKTGIQLKFRNRYVVEANLNGTEADITSYNDDNDGVDVYGNRAQVKPATVPADEAVSTDETDDAPADTAASTKAGKIKISLGKEFNDAVVEGLNGVKVIIRLGANDENDVVYTKGGIGYGEAIPAAEAEAGEPGLEVNGEVLRLTLARGRVYDVNTATGKVIVHRDVKSGDNAELAKPVPVDDKYHKIVISEDGTSLTLNKTSIEKTAGGVVTVATDGIGRIKPVDQSPSAIAAAEVKIGKDVEDGWKFLLVKADGTEVDVSTEKFGSMTRKDVDKMIERLREENVDLPDAATLKKIFAHAAKFDVKTDGKYSERQFHAKDGGVVTSPSGIQSAGGRYDSYGVIVVRYKPAPPAPKN